jgi:hypothetical protein
MEGRRLSPRASQQYDALTYSFLTTIYGAARTSEEIRQLFRQVIPLSFSGREQVRTSRYEPSSPRRAMSFTVARCLVSGQVILFRNISLVTRKDQSKTRKAMAGATIVSPAMTQGRGSSNMDERSRERSILRLLSN